MEGSLVLVENALLVTLAEVLQKNATGHSQRSHDDLKMWILYQMV